MGYVISVIIINGKLGNIVFYHSHVFNACAKDRLNSVTLGQTVNVKIIIYKRYAVINLFRATRNYGYFGFFGIFITACPISLCSAIYASAGVVKDVICSYDSFSIAVTAIYALVNVIAVTSASGLRGLNAVIVVVALGKIKFKILVTEDSGDLCFCLVSVVPLAHMNEVHAVLALYFLLNSSVGIEDKLCSVTVKSCNNVSRKLLLVHAATEAPSLRVKAVSDRLDNLVILISAAVASVSIVALCRASGLPNVNRFHTLVLALIFVQLYPYGSGFKHRLKFGFHFVNVIPGTALQILTVFRLYKSVNASVGIKGVEHVIIPKLVYNVSFGLRLFNVVSAAFCINAVVHSHFRNVDKSPKLTVKVKVDILHAVKVGVPPLALNVILNKLAHGVHMHS